MLHEVESKHSANWFFWLGETSSTDGLNGEGFISWKRFVNSTMPITVYIKHFLKEHCTHLCTGVVDNNINRSVARDSLGPVELR